MSTPPQVDAGRTLHRCENGRFTPPIPVDKFSSVKIWVPCLDGWMAPKFIPYDGDPYWVSTSA